VLPARDTVLLCARIEAGWPGRNAAQFKRADRRSRTRATPLSGFLCNRQSFTPRLGVHCTSLAHGFIHGPSTMTPDIDLTDAERALFEQILFDWSGASNPYDVTTRNGERVTALMASLVPRGGIPSQRMSYFNDPDYRTGRLKGSRADLFLRNCKTVEEMVRHSGFLQHLRYFVCGPDLPASALKEFKDAVKSCGQVSGSDALELGELARKQVRTYGLSSYDVAVEYFRAAIDGGVWVTRALTIEKRVEALRFVPAVRDECPPGATMTQDQRRAGNSVEVR
jgi:hypothetical protein